MYLKTRKYQHKSRKHQHKFDYIKLICTCFWIYYILNQFSFLKESTMLYCRCMA